MAAAREGADKNPSGFAGRVGVAAAREGATKKARRRKSMRAARLLVSRRRTARESPPRAPKPKAAESIPDERNQHRTFASPRASPNERRAARGEISPRWQARIVDRFARVRVGTPWPCMVLRHPRKCPGGRKTNMVGERWGCEKAVQGPSEILFSARRHGRLLRGAERIQVR